MTKKNIRFYNSKVIYYLDDSVLHLKKIADRSSTVLITDENVLHAHPGIFKNWNTIVLKAGEEFKIQATVDSVIGQLIEMKADRQTLLVGIGGGVITDLTGFIASIYMRGIAFGFVPSTLLAMVDASIGGKNGIDTGNYKNMVGIVKQPSFILQDARLLKSLPHKEWRNGFAEIIKHASISNAQIFRELESKNINHYQKKHSELSALIIRNIMLKTKFVQLDEFEKNERRKLNFGHTLGHAIEKEYEISHGEAISIGMAYAAKISSGITGFKGLEKIHGILDKYELPVHTDFDREKIFSIMCMDKKKYRERINFILLEKIGKAVIKEIPVKQLYQMLQ